ncbi:MAG: pyridoxal 5'-phosphate synthase glutaminase subunit PdxT [Desulfitobacterium sp.]|nr:pyridoxal 5'-phosphate synthase glutaminase subunit PdxT [Desulfitobacterium sp.]
MKLKIGVLAQSTFDENCVLLEALNCEIIKVEKAEDIEEIQGLIISVNDNSAINKLILSELGDRIKKFAARDFPIYGICGGMILLSKDTSNYEQPRLGLMDIDVAEKSIVSHDLSVTANLLIPALGDIPFPAIFLNSPYIKRIKPNVGILAEYNDKIVFVRQGNMLASSFHPELASDCRVHQYFINMVKEHII